MGAAAQESSSSPGAEELGRLCSLVPYLARSDSAQEPRGNIFSPRRLGSGQSRWSVCVRSPLHSRPRRRSCGPHIPGDNGPGERQRCRRRRASAHPSLPLGPGPPARSAAPTRRGSPASRGRRAERHAGRGQARPPPRRLGPACSPRHRRCLRCAPAEPGELGPGYCPRSAPAGRPGASGAVRTGAPWRGRPGRSAQPQSRPRSWRAASPPGAERNLMFF